MRLQKQLFITAISLALIIGVKPLSALNVSVTVNASTVTHVISDRLYSANGNVGETIENGTNTAFNNLIIASGMKYFRWPGGSTADGQSWDSTSPVSYAQGLTMLSTIGGGVMLPTVNFSGYWRNTQHTQQQAEAKAAAWVRNYNVTRGLGAKYWEIGNEDYGPWETGHTTGADYGFRFCAFYDSMKRVDSTIKIGAIVTPPFPFDTFFSNFSIHALDTIAKLNHVPDFLIAHFYPYIQMDQYSTMFGYNMLPAGPSHLKDTMTTGIWIDTLSSAFDTINKWVSTYFGSSNVGKIQYFITEYSTGSYATQNQGQTISAWAIAQMLMELARLGVTGFNPWQVNYYDSAAGNPTGYVHPMFIYHYGKQVVNVTLGTHGTRMRAWAAKDTMGNLTMFLVNNAVDSTTDTAQIAIQGVAGVGAAGEQWTMLTSGSAGSWQPERSAISINGVVSPAASTIKTLTGKSIATGSSFNVPLPPYSMTWLRIPITISVLPTGKAQETPVRVIVRQTGIHTLTITSSMPNSNRPWSFSLFGIDGKKIGDWRLTGNRTTLDLRTAMRGVLICRLIMDGKEYGKTLVMK